jgi:hypothetical protein
VDIGKTYSLYARTMRDSGNIIFDP